MRSAGYYVVCLGEEVPIRGVSVVDDKGTPAVRWVRKATGPSRSAGLPNRF